MSSSKLQHSKLQQQDRALVQIVDAAFAEAARKSGSWLLCRPGCTQCCIGVFAINQLDAMRLRQGMIGLEARAPERAAAVRARARSSIQNTAAQFPGDPKTGVLYEDEESKKRFEGFANDEPCPALDPRSGRCELYESRPMTCRVFGPPVRLEDGLAVCELCFQGATADEVAACEMHPDPDDQESVLVTEAEKIARKSGETIVAYCLAS
jgi:Fe-S-cluster containining protein